MNPENDEKEKAPLDECSAWKDCNSCTSHTSWTGTCEYCEVPEPITGAVCHDPYSPVNPCNLFCDSFNVFKPEDCPMPRPMEYDPKTAETMLHLCAAAYSNFPDLCFQNLPGESHWKLYKAPISATCDYGGNVCFGYTAVSTQTKSIVIAFRGSNSFGQVLEELALGVFPKKAWPPGGTVISYFYNAFILLWPRLSAQFTELVASNPGYTVYVAGHSLGGALASMAASSMVYEKIHSDPIVYTFGQPRVGDWAYAKEFDSKIKKAWRVIHYADPVPHVPMCGETIFDPPICNPCADFPHISSGYHHAQEIWYNRTHFFFRPDDPYSVCTNWISNEDVTCSNSEVFHGGLPCITSACLRYHTYYFSMAVGSCGFGNCTDPFICNNPG